MAAKRKQATRSNNGNDGGSPWPAWVWMGLGVLLGLALSAVVLMKDWAPLLRKKNLPTPNPEASAPKETEPAVADEGKKPTKKSYDFYSVLPEMEVVIPDAELSAKARAEQQRLQQAAANGTTPATAGTTPATAGTTPPPEPTTATAGVRYLLQAGSYPDPKGAEEVKAKLALLGFIAKVQPVTVNGKTWNRVRVGPYASASDVEAAKKALADSGVNAIALKETGAE